MALNEPLPNPPAGVLRPLAHPVQLHRDFATGWSRTFTGIRHGGSAPEVFFTYAPPAQPGGEWHLSLRRKAADPTPSATVFDGMERLLPSQLHGSLRAHDGLFGHKAKPTVAEVAALVDALSALNSARH